MRDAAAQQRDGLGGHVRRRPQRDQRVGFGAQGVDGAAHVFACSRTKRSEPIGAPRNTYPSSSVGASPRGYRSRSAQSAASVRRVSSTVALVSGVSKMRHLALLMISPMPAKTSSTLVSTSHTTWYGARMEPSSRKARRTPSSMPCMPARNVSHDAAELGECVLHRRQEEHGAGQVALAHPLLGQRAGTSRSGSLSAGATTPTATVATAWPGCEPRPKAAPARERRWPAARGRAAPSSRRSSCPPSSTVTCSGLHCNMMLCVKTPAAPRPPGVITPGPASSPGKST